MNNPWFEELRRIEASVQNAERALRALCDSLGAGVLHDISPRASPKGAATAIERLVAELAAIRDAQRQALERYCLEPAEKWYRGQLLTREEYYLFAASVECFMTAKQLGLSQMDDYDVFCLMCYEDDDCRCYINPFEWPRDSSSGKVGLRIGRPPEELRADALRSEQREFFARYLPEVYPRFRS